MERLKRHKLKKQAKIRTILAWLIGVGGTLLLVIIMFVFITPPPTDSLLISMIFSFFMFSPMIIGFILGLSAQGKRDLLRDERNRMYREKDEMYFSMFTKKIKDGDYNDADISDLFLSLKLIKGDDRDRNKAIESIDRILKIQIKK